MCVLFCFSGCVLLVYVMFCLLSVFCLFVFVFSHVLLFVFVFAVLGVYCFAFVCLWGYVMFSCFLYFVLLSCVCLFALFIKYVKNVLMLFVFGFAFWVVCCLSMCLFSPCSVCLLFLLDLLFCYFVVLGLFCFAFVRRLGYVCFLYFCMLFCFRACFCLICLLLILNIV